MSFQEQNNQHWGKESIRCRGLNHWGKPCRWVGELKGTDGKRYCHHHVR